jgi:endoglycosylceramidase
MFAGNNRIGACIVLILLLMISSAQIISSVQAAQNGKSTHKGGFLRAEGRSIVDQAGDVALLRGANFYGYEYGFLDRHTESDYKRMASWGFNVVRLPVAWNFIEPQQGVYDERYLSYVDRDIKWAKKYGLYIILDMHQFGWSPYFTYFDPLGRTAGVPSWAVSTYADTAEGNARARADFWESLGPNGTPTSDMNPSMQDRFVQMWKYVASRYAQQETVAAYDLFNEPTVYSSGGGNVKYYDVSKLCSETLPAFYEKVVDGIRTVDGNHMILWEPANIWNRITSRVNRPNMAFSPHYPGYSPFYKTTGIGMSESGYDGNKTRLEASLLNTVIRLSEEWDIPVFVGEWGICVEALNAIQYIYDFAELMGRYALSGAWWTYGKSTFGMNLLDKDGNERAALVQNLLQAMKAWA